MFIRGRRKHLLGCETVWPARAALRVPQPKRARKKTTRSEAKTIAAPIEQLDHLLSTTEKLKSELTKLYHYLPLGTWLKI